MFKWHQGQLNVDLLGNQRTPDSSGHHDPLRLDKSSARMNAVHLASLNSNLKGRRMGEDR
jgi:hypothetical protein